MKSFKLDDLALKSPTKAQRVSLSAIGGEYSTQPLESKISYLIQSFFH